MATGVVSTNVSNGSCGNSDGSHTTHYHLPGLVIFCVYCGGLATVLSILFNVLVVAAFARKPRLITPFTIQFLNFVIIQLCTMLIDGPLNVVSHLNASWYFKPTFCALYKFGAWTFPSLALLQQMAISIDRWLALLAPVWYRTKTVKFGILVTIYMTVFYSVLYLPLFVVDTVIGVPTGCRCDYHHALSEYQLFVRVATYYLPLGFTYLSYPLLVIMIRRRRNAKIHAATTRANVMARTRQFGQELVAEISGDRAVSGLPIHMLDARMSVYHSQQADLAKLLKESRRSRSNSNKQRLSMWMMLVQIIFSLPLTVTYTMVQTGAHPPYLQDINTVSILLTAINVVIDPVMYWIFFKDLREETIRLIQCQFFA